MSTLIYGATGLLVGYLLGKWRSRKLTNSEERSLFFAGMAHGRMMTTLPIDADAEYQVERSEYMGRAN